MHFVCELISCSYVLNMQVFILHALPFGLWVGCLAWRLPFLRVQTPTSRTYRPKSKATAWVEDVVEKSQPQKTQPVATAFNGMLSSWDDDQKHEPSAQPKSIHSSEPLQMQSTFGNGKNELLLIPQPQSSAAKWSTVYNNYVLALDLFSTVLVIFVPVSLIAPALVLYYLVGQSFVWMWAWICYWGACFCAAISINTLSKSNDLDQLRFTCTFKNMERWGKIILSSALFVVLMISSLTMCMHQENTFPFFRLHYTVVLWCQIAALVATSSTVLFVMTREKTNSVIDQVLSGRNVEDEGSKVLGKVVSWIVRIIFSPLYVLIALRGLFDAVLKCTQVIDCSNYITSHWSQTCTDQAFNRLGMCMWFGHVLMEGVKNIVLLWPLKLAYNLLIFPFVVCRYVLFLITMPLHDKLPTRIHYRNLYMFTGCITLLIMLIRSRHMIQQPAKEMFSEAALKAGYHLHWPAGPSFLDAPFAMFEKARAQKYIIQWVSFVIFLVAQYMHHAYIDDSKTSVCNFDDDDDDKKRIEHADDYDLSEHNVAAFGSLGWSRTFVYLGSLTVLAATMVESIPDYIGASKLNQVLPNCAPQFNLMLHTVFRSLVGCLASAVCVAQMFGILLSLTPTLGRVSFLTLLQNRHLEVGEEDRTEVLRLLLVYSTVFTPISTCLPATLICQLLCPDDMFTSVLFLLFWIIPPCVVFVYRMLAWAALTASPATDKTVDSVSYFLFLASYLAMLIITMLHIVAINHWENYLTQEINEPNTWLTLVSGILLTNVAISDMLASLTESSAPVDVDDRVPVGSRLCHTLIFQHIINFLVVGLCLSEKFCVTCLRFQTHLCTSARSDSNYSSSRAQLANFSHVYASPIQLNIMNV
jgi:hypothetical protein